MNTCRSAAVAEVVPSCAASFSTRVVETTRGVVNSFTRPRTWTRRRSSGTRRPRGSGRPGRSPLSQSPRAARRGTALKQFWRDSKLERNELKYTNIACRYCVFCSSEYGWVKKLKKAYNKIFSTRWGLYR